MCLHKISLYDEVIIKNSFTLFSQKLLINQRKNIKKGIQKNSVILMRELLNILGERFLMQDFKINKP